MGDYQVTEFLMKRTSVKQPFHKIIHALLPYITVMTATCDGAEAEVGAYIQLYNAEAQSFSESTNLPPQGSGYIELICCVPTGWQKLNVTFVPTFVANKSLTFTLSSSDIAQA